ncbi:MAG: quercetin dioxygenase-like cupin family protein [Planctomycetota bacterium]
MSNKNPTDRAQDVYAGLRSARLILPCRDLSQTLRFLQERLGFRTDRIFPADDPREAWVSGLGLQLILLRDAEAAPAEIRVECDASAAKRFEGDELTGPGGLRIELLAPPGQAELPALRSALIISRSSDSAQWIVGRAGMRYRDLIPGRLGGRFIASHIAIPDGGPVPDSVHFHAIHFQLIYCLKGWVRVVYEDQGEPFVLKAGDAVLQPPLIRHRVLEASEGLEVLEVSCPAEHETMIDHRLQLPNPTHKPERDFSGQGFVRHIAEQSTWTAADADGFERCTTAIERATDGLASVEIARPCAARTPIHRNHNGPAFHFVYVLSGKLSLTGDDSFTTWLNMGDSIVLPSELEWSFGETSSDLMFVDVRVQEA